ncbi:MAG: hypothetical protein NC915_03520 [Candidatus Omnitrophica bacterium]|nr:hypothetical protein [Candidatus Omnitrophota bacterium]
MIEKEKFYNSIKYFKKINEKTYQLLGWLGFTKEETLKTDSGEWEIYVRRNFIFPYFNREKEYPSINKFCAIFKNKRESIIYGIFENLDELKNNLIKITEIFLKKEKKFLGIPLTLTEENAQDYGYIRGLILGFSLILIDFLYSFIFKLKNGIITGFIEYVKVVYYGTPGFGIFVGITGTGLYFIFILIVIPILFGLYYKKMAVKKILKKTDKFIEELISYHYEGGIEAERTIEDEFYLIIEEKRKEQIYKELQNFITIEKRDFEILYEKLKIGFLKLQDLIDFIKNYTEIFKQIPLIKFLEIIKKYETADIETEIKFQFKLSQE